MVVNGDDGDDIDDTGRTMFFLTTGYDNCDDFVNMGFVM